jgi:PBP1b-binding outer membrane lipoprotein LpoB
MMSAALLSAALLSGCASVPMADATADAQAKQFVAPKDAANLYIYRNENFGTAVKMPVLVDDMAVGDTVAHSYILKQVTPGSHTITSKSENDATLTLSTEAGKNYYVWQEVKMGLLMARSKLSQVSEEEGKQGVMESKRIK